MTAAIVILSVMLHGVSAEEPAASDSNGRTIPREAYANFVKGVSAQILGEKEAALEFFEKAESLDHDSVEVVRKLAELYQELEKPKQALKHFKRVLELAPDDFDGNWQLGRLYFRDNKLPLATVHLEKAASLKSGDIRLHFLLATLYRMTKRMPDCARQYEIVLRSNPSLVRTSQALERIYRRLPEDAAEIKKDIEQKGGTDFVSYFRLALLQQEERNFGLALKSLEQALEIEPKWNFGHQMSAKLYRRLGQNLDAVHAYLSAALRHPDRSELLYEVADIYIDMGEYNRAAQTLERVRQIWPKYKETLYRLLYCYQLLDQNEKAIAIGQEYLQKFGGKINLMAYELMGKCYAALGQLDSAGKCAEEVKLARDDAEDDNEYVLMSRIMAQILSAADRRKEAITALEEGLARGDHQDSRLFLAVLYDEEKLDKKAELALKGVLTGDPQNHRALNHLGYLYAERGRNLDEAVSLITEALKADPKNWAYLDSLAWAYYKLGRLDEALVKLHEAINIHDDPVLRDHLGDVYQALGNTSKAREHWEKAIALDPEMESARDKLKNSDLKEK